MKIAWAVVAIAITGCGVEDNIPAKIEFDKKPIVSQPIKQEQEALAPETILEGTWSSGCSTRPEWNGSSLSLLETYSRDRFYADLKVYSMSGCQGEPKQIQQWGNFQITRHNLELGFLDFSREYITQYPEDAPSGTFGRLYGNNHGREVIFENDRMITTVDPNYLITAFRLEVKKQSTTQPIPSQPSGLHEIPSACPDFSGNYYQKSDFGDRWLSMKQTGCKELVETNLNTDGTLPKVPCPNRYRGDGIWWADVLSSRRSYFTQSEFFLESYSMREMNWIVSYSLTKQCPCGTACDLSQGKTWLVKNKIMSKYSSEESCWYWEKK